MVSVCQASADSGELRLLDVKNDGVVSKIRLGVDDYALAHGSGLHAVGPVVVLGQELLCRPVVGQAHIKIHQVGPESIDLFRRAIEPVLPMPVVAAAPVV